MSMEMTRAADYGLRAMVYLSHRGSGRSVFIGEIAEAMGIPAQFLHKVMPRLVKVGFLHSRRGARGGYKLARQLEDIKVLDIIEAIDGPIIINRCLIGSSDCDRMGMCSIQEICKQAQQAVTQKFGEFTLADVVRMEEELQG